MALAMIRFFIFLNMEKPMQSFYLKKKMQFLTGEKPAEAAHGLFKAEDPDHVESAQGVKRL